MTDRAGAGSAPIRHPWPDPPAPGDAVEIRPGLLWMRIPLPIALDHINVYALDDGAAGWTVLDTGFDTPDSRDLWQRLIDGPLQGRPVHRLVVSHFHPDHIGLSGWFQARGAQVWTTRQSWLSAQMQAHRAMAGGGVPPATRAFWQAAGVDPAEVAVLGARQPGHFAERVGMADRYSRLAAGDVIQMGGLRWTVRTGDGHAAEQATFWSGDGQLVLGADQLLPRITPVIPVFPDEPDADPISEWIGSCRRLADFATEDQLVLPGHKLPYTGLPRRLTEMVDHHHAALDRLQAHLAQPRLAVECFPVLFRRNIGPEVFLFAVGETVAHLNHLLRLGRVRREPADDGAWRWQAAG